MQIWVELGTDFDQNVDIIPKITAMFVSILDYQAHDTETVCEFIPFLLGVQSLNK